ncbi:MAG: hypothetical protein QOD30_188 [Actinomycetota bacterium]|nr:hypothetical protein [Actinomycetota bacterium]
MSGDYVAGHLEEALVHSGETDVRVVIEAERVVISGTVATEERRVAVAELAGTVTELDVANEVVVVTVDAP